MTEAERADLVERQLAKIQAGWVDAALAMIADYRRLLAERALPVRAPCLLPPERPAEIRARLARLAGKDFSVSIHEGDDETADDVEAIYRDTAALLAHAETLESLLADVGGETWAVREAGARAEREAVLALLRRHAEQCRRDDHRQPGIAARAMVAAVAAGMHAEAAPVPAV